MIETYDIRQPDRTQEYINHSLVKVRECSHNFQLTQTQQRNGVLQFRARCIICGETRGEALKYASLTDQQRQQAIVYDPQTAGDYYAAKECARQEEIAKMQRVCDSANERKNRAWWLWYSDYLHSQVWQRRRQAVMRRARGICEACQVASATEVHHLTYAHVGREPLFELVAVCTKCHEQITAWDRVQE